MRLTPAEFDQAVEAALAEIPDEFRRYLENVVIEVHAKPDPTLIPDDEHPDEVLGLYLGVPVEDWEVGASAVHMPDRVLIFRDALCDMCESREELIAEIRITLLHEIGHHFGMDEDRLEQLGYD